MRLTLKKIMKFDPCGQNTDGKTGISLLAKNLGKTDFNDDVEFELIEVLNSNNIEDAIWCFKCFNYLDYCLFLADVAESVLHIYESKNDSKAPRKAIQGVRDYKSGKITKEGLKVLANDAYFVTVNSDPAAAHAAYVAAAYTAYSSDYYSAVYAAASASAAFAVDYAVASSSSYAAADSAEEWNEIEQLFIKHFGV